MDIEKQLELEEKNLFLQREVEEEEPQNHTFLTDDLQQEGGDQI